MKKVFAAFNFSKEDIDRWKAVPSGDDDTNVEGLVEGVVEGVSFPMSPRSLDLSLMVACGARGLDRLGEIQELVTFGANIHYHNGYPFQLAVGTHNSTIGRSLLSDEKLRFAENFRRPLLSDENLRFDENLRVCKEVIEYLLSIGSRFTVTYDGNFGLANCKRIRLYRLRKWLGFIK